MKAGCTGPGSLSALFLSLTCRVCLFVSPGDKAVASIITRCRRVPSRMVSVRQEPGPGTAGTAWLCFMAEVSAGRPRGWGGPSEGTRADAGCWLRLSWGCGRNTRMWPPHVVRAPHNVVAGFHWEHPERRGDKEERGSEGGGCMSYDTRKP